MGVRAVVVQAVGVVVVVKWRGGFGAGPAAVAVGVVGKGQVGQFGLGRGGACFPEVAVVRAGEAVQVVVGVERVIVARGHGCAAAGTVVVVLEVVDEAGVRGVVRDVLEHAARVVIIRGHVVAVHIRAPHLRAAACVGGV